MINEFNSEINPITGEKEIGIDYFYITSKNKKIKLLPNQFPDSLEALPFQQEFNLSYLDSSTTFKVLFQDKVYLFSHTGKQLSEGYDNITESKLKHFYYTENYITKNEKNYITKGLIDTNNLVIVPCKYKSVSINTEDTLIYCCSAVFDNLKNDDVYSKNGKLKHISSNHIEFASNNYLITKIYTPKIHFIQEEINTKLVTKLDAQSFQYLKDNLSLIVYNNDWYIYNLVNHKKTKIDKEDFMNTIIKLIN